jgi:hypothetical protein
LLFPVVSISLRINKADVTVREMLDSAFRQNFDDFVGATRRGPDGLARMEAVDSLFISMARSA